MLCSLGGVFSSQSSDSTLNEAEVISATESIDSYLAAISSVTPLDVMPGSKDPTGIMLPQKPFHYCKFCCAYYINICN